MTESQPNLQRLPTPPTRYLVGDVVFASVAIKNDGGFPGVADDALIAEAGARGVIANVGYAEQNPAETVYAVQFEALDGSLGPAVGCLPAELTQQEPAE